MSDRRRTPVGFIELAELMERGYSVQTKLLEQILHVDREILRAIKYANTPHPTAFRFSQSGVTSMQTLSGLAPGTSGIVTVQPIDKDGNSVSLPTGIVPVWTRSNDQILITPAADGLSAEIAVDTAAAPDPTTTLTVAYPDGSVSSTVGFPIDPNPAPPVGAVAGFTFTQS